ncbi:33752_t:CDS:1, partial [Gigaspora margarita]
KEPKYHTNDEKTEALLLVKKNQNTIQIIPATKLLKKELKH